MTAIAFYFGIIFLGDKSLYAQKWMFTAINLILFYLFHNFDDKSPSSYQQLFIEIYSWQLKTTQTRARTHTHTFYTYIANEWHQLDSQSTLWLLNRIYQLIDFNR